MKKNSIIALVLTVSLALTTTSAFGLTHDYKTTRLGGQNKIDTAIEISKEFAQNDTITNCIIGNCDNYADNISATPLSVYKNAPILLTEKDSLNSKTQQRLADMKIKNIFIIGGIGAVGQSVEDKLCSLGYNVTRFSGNDRFETNRAIMNYIPKEVWGPHPKIIDGYNWVQGICVAVDCKYEETTKKDVSVELPDSTPEHRKYKVETVNVKTGNICINPIFLVKHDTSKISEVQDIADMIKSLSNRWKYEDNKLTFEYDTNMIYNLMNRVEKENTNKDLDRYGILALQRAATDEFFQSFVPKENKGSFGIRINDEYAGNMENSLYTIYDYSVDKSGNYPIYRNQYDFDKALLIGHNDFINALVSAPLAAKLSAPIVLVDPSRSSEINLNKLGLKDIYNPLTDVSKIYYIGGADGVPDGIESMLK